MFDRLAATGRSALYWLALAMLGLSSEAVALFYQYGLDEAPCVMCIQVRLWFTALILVALLVAGLRRLRRVPLAGHLVMAVIAAGILERAWRLLGTERGFLISDCGFGLGLPAWFTPERWLPALYEVQTTCGYTPELLFGVTMAEALLVFSAVLLLLSLVMLVATVRHDRTGH